MKTRVIREPEAVRDLSKTLVVHATVLRVIRVAPLVRSLARARDDRVVLLGCCCQNRRCLMGFRFPNACVTATANCSGSRLVPTKNFGFGRRWKKFRRT